MDDWTLGHLACPRCGASLEVGSDSVHCTASKLRHSFPVVEGVPVLINEANSLFSHESFLASEDTFFPSRSRLALAVDALVPSLVMNPRSRSLYRRFVERLRDSDGSRVLVLGGSVAGQGMEPLLSERGLHLVETDVAFGARTQMIVDAHDIPFADESFDGLVAQAVLEHVWDTRRCVHEILRVLRPGGLLYVEVPLMQPVHGGAYDFVRYTHTGLRGLFRDFEEIDSGAACGPGVGLAYQFTYFLQAFARPGVSRKVANRIGRMLSFWVKYLDYLIVDRETALDAAASLYFLGRKTSQRREPSEIVADYRGGFRNPPQTISPTHG